MKRRRLGRLLALGLAILASMQAAPGGAQPGPPAEAPKAASPAGPTAPLSNPPASAASNDATADTATAATITAAAAESDHWLSMIDHGQFAETWIAAAVVLQEAIPQKEWIDDLTARRPKLGRTIMRERKSESYSRTLRGAPTGDYVIVTYLTQFEKTPLVEETLAVAKDAIGQWHVAGYDIALSSVKAP